ncbi:MAG: hypothetical protein CM1200mP29_14940 [Verrucomicrobiota bacterium]|nr:MAG: hypothetical protein CM1200mP29_14940 [Verrucomicrobiota bacterium]
MVERLLASERYGERGGRHWLDVVRYADTAGENTDMPVADAWRYRNFVIRAFNEDRPFDQFIREKFGPGGYFGQGRSKHFTGAVQQVGHRHRLLAISGRHGHDAKKDHYLTIEDTIDTLGKSFLGPDDRLCALPDHNTIPSRRGTTTACTASSRARCILSPRLGGQQAHHRPDAAEEFREINARWPSGTNEKPSWNKK